MSVKYTLYGYVIYVENEKSFPKVIYNKLFLSKFYTRKSIIVSSWILIGSFLSKIITWKK